MTVPLRSVRAWTPSTRYAAKTGALYAWVAGAAFAAFIGLAWLVSDIQAGGFDRSTQDTRSAVVAAVAGVMLFSTVALVVTTVIALPLGALLGAGNVALVRTGLGPARAVVATSGLLVAVLGALLPQVVLRAGVLWWLDAAAASAAGLSFGAHQQMLRRQSARRTQVT
jgi:hypothetical protein